MMELYHIIADIDCARVRRKIMELDLKSEIDFRNIDASSSARVDLEQGLGRIEVPALKTATRWVVGAKAIIDHLEQVVAV